MDRITNVENNEFDIGFVDDMRKSMMQNEFMFIFDGVMDHGLTKTLVSAVEKEMVQRG